ncbi:CPBP family intramembrane glutamic endopeptidase [Microcella sp.]|uniref:CPBP family intramembrane glutamic endopeptidase n=1 Tax=Microcella sp. TaxID=1913979 RepID=UPI00299F69A0|nr:CPBP family intramembrane glutamic endopeptidase [Microcella sp.]MDX2026766.1 CPBP family intramembrane glutamic endopeptidase [Microcella sp.]
MIDYPPPVRQRFYHEALSEPRRPWWVAALALATFAVSAVVVSVVLSFAAVELDLFLGLTSPDSVAAGQFSITPTLFLANNLFLASLIPLSMLIQWAFFGVRPRRMHSIIGAWRWHLMGRAAQFIVPIFLLYTGVGLVLAAASLIAEPPNGTTVALLLMIVLTTPFQAAGEEYAFRGFIARTVGSWSSRTEVSFAIGTIASSIVFALVHFAADPWLIAYYLVFAVGMSLIVRATGGLEIAVLIHALNNVLLLIPAVVLSSLEESLNRDFGAAGPYALVPMLVITGITLAVLRWAPRRGVVASAPVPPRRLPKVATGHRDPQGQRLDAVGDDVDDTLG